MVISIDSIEIELNGVSDIALREVLIENAHTILTTLRGTNPQNRGMGFVSSDIIGRPVYAARGAYSVQAIEQIDTYEPRLSVVEINFTATESKLIPKVVLTYNGD